MEFTIGFLLSSRDLLGSLPRFFVSLMRGIHFYAELSIIQYESMQAQYDPGLFYTLRPGSFEQKNREFSVTFHVNKLGLRDDEHSMDRPEVVVLGDSFAMGWGVEQGDTFSQQIEEQTGLKVLNAGISSFGTVREMKIFERVDKKGILYLIIQYMYNDYEENFQFHEKGNQLVIGDEKIYQKAVLQNKKTRTYYFGKYSYWLGNRLSWKIRNYIAFKLSTNRMNHSTENEENSVAKLFLNAVKSGLERVDLTNVNIIAFDIAPFGHNSPLFKEQVEEEIQTGNYSFLNERMKLLDISNHLDAFQHYYSPFFWSQWGSNLKYISFATISLPLSPK